VKVGPQSVINQSVSRAERLLSGGRVAPEKGYLKPPCKRPHWMVEEAQTEREKDRKEEEGGE